MSQKRKGLSYERKKRLYGYGFIGLWLFGTIFYLIRPLVDVIRYSFSQIEITDMGYTLLPAGISHYHYIFREDPNYLPNLVASLADLAYQVPVILVFSFMLAVVLNQKFHGRTLMRTIFFIPVIVASGVVIGIMNADPMAQGMISGVRTSAMSEVTGFQEYLLNLGLPETILTPVVRAVNDIFNLTWKSGIQILILMAGLQTVPSSLYEASSIDGATGWENFWKITFPMVSPMLILVFVYTVIDSFTDYNNGLMRMIMERNNTGSAELAAAMILVYMVIIVVIIGVIYGVINRFVFYGNERG